VRFDPEFIQDHFSSAQNYIEFVRDFLEMEGDNTWDKRMCIWYPTDAVRIGDHPMAMFYSFPEKFSLKNVGTRRCRVPTNISNALCEFDENTPKKQGF